MSHSIQHSLEIVDGCSVCVCVRERHTRLTDLVHKSIAQLKAEFENGEGRNVCVCERERHIAMCVCVRETHTSQCVCV